MITTPAACMTSRFSVGAVAALVAIASAASAFQCTNSNNVVTHHVSSEPSLQPTRHSTVLSAHYYHPPYSERFDPYFPHYPNIPYQRGRPNYRPPPMRSGPPPRYYADPHGSNGSYHPRRREKSSPRYSAAVDAEVVTSEADDLLNEISQEEEDEMWMTDGERARGGQNDNANYRKKGRGQTGEVIDFDPDGRPLKSAAAYPSDLYEDENKFYGRKPGQAVNRNDEDDFETSSVNENKIMEEDDAMGADPREQHVILDEYDEYMMNGNDFFRHPVIPPPMPPPPPPMHRRGPPVYTREEEELIASMGGGSRPTTQEFAGLGTMMRKDGMPPSRYESEMPTDPQRRNYNPEEQRFIPPPPIPPLDGPLPPPHFREEGYLGDSTLKEISLDYAIPIPYLADVLATWDVPVPIDPNVRLGDMVTGEQAFAILEAIHTLDVAALHERYSEDNLMNICDFYDIDLKEAFEFCIGRGWALPFGVRTFLRVEQEEELLDALG